MMGNGVTVLRALMLNILYGIQEATEKDIWSRKAWLICHLSREAMNNDYMLGDLSNRNLLFNVL